MLDGLFEVDEEKKGGYIKRGIYIQPVYNSILNTISREIGLSYLLLDWFESQSIKEFGMQVCSVLTSLLWIHT